MSCPPYCCNRGCISSFGRIHTMPKSTKPQDAKNTKDARNKISSLVFILNEIMFPRYVSLIDITVLLLVSKRFRRSMDALKTIMQYICTYLYIPKVFTKGIKLSTVLKKRATNSIIYSLTSEENLRLSESCISCLYCPRCVSFPTLNLASRQIRISKCLLGSNVCHSCITQKKVYVRPEKDEFVIIQGVNIQNGMESNWNLLIGIDGNTGIVKHLRTQDISFQRMKMINLF